MAETETEAETEAPAYRMSAGRVAALFILAALPVALTGVAQLFLPDTVPVHYALSGPDDWGPKAELFLGAGIFTAIALAVAAIYAVTERQRETGREDWIVGGEGLTRMSFPLAAGSNAVMACLQAAYVFAAIQLTDFTMPVDVGKLYVYAILGLVLLAMLAPALYMLITGKGLSLVNFHPGTSDLEKSIGADKQQARAVGGLLLFLAVFVIVEFAVIVK